MTNKNAVPVRVAKNAPRKGLALLLMVSLLLMSVFSGLAWAIGEDSGPSQMGAGFMPAGTTSPGDLAALAEDAERVEAQPAVDPLAAEELPHSGLDRSEAGELLVGVFGGGLESSAEFLGDLDVEAFRSDYVAVVAPPEPGADLGLVTSLLPLRAENEQGDKELIDLSLESQGDHLEASNPLVPVEIPAELSEGITLPDLGIVIDVGAGDTTPRQASEVGEATAFFPNVRTDSDLVVSPIPTGVETYTHLRSAEAPTTETFELTLPKGGTLDETAQGAQVVDASGSPILSVYAPFAIDAEETSIPVSVDVSGDSRVVVSVDPPADAAYPILVDPVFENYTWMNSNSNTGIGTDWRSGTQNQERLWPSWVGVWNQTMHAGLNLRSYAGPIAPGSQANWNYYVPRYFSDYENPAVAERPTSFIRNMTLSQVYWLIEEGAPVHPHPFMMVGLWDENKGEFASLGTRDSTQGPYNGVSLPLPNPGEYTDVKNGGISLATYESTSYPRQAFVGGAWVELSDKDSPLFGELGSVPEWVSTKAGTPINYKVTDKGIGVHNLRLEYTKATGIKGTPITGVGCTGNSANPCPRTVSKATNQIPYYPDLMPQGENWINVYAVDAVSHWSEAGVARIKVDRSAPEPSTSGTLTEQAKVGVNLSEYSLELSTVDGDEAAATAASPIGSAGTGPGQLERPQGLAVDGSGNTWVTDRTNQRVVEYDSAGKLVREINAKGSGDGQINEPRGAAIATNGNVWVAEAGNKRIQQFNPTGGFVSKIVNAAFVEPWGVAVAPDGTLWVTDPGAKKVFLFKEDGTLIRTISSTPVLGGGSPFGIDVDEFNNAWVALQGTDQIMALNPAGESIVTFGGTGTEAGKFKNPVDVAIAPSGNLFVSDDLNNRIQEFRPGGLFMRQFGTAGSASNQLKEPRAIDVTSLGNELMVADAGNKRVARWTHADRHPESGTVKTEIKVDGVLKDITNPGCAEKNCKITRKWTLKADDYPVGTHTVEVIATDGVGLQSKKTIQIETHGDLQAPQLALSGTMTEQATLGNTRPTYKIKAAATDPGLSTERKSGVASTSIKVDGVTVDSSAPGCPSGGCSITRESTLNSSTYSVGTHLVEVKATDAAGRSTVKVLSLKIERDTTPPALTLSGALPSAPEGWVQQAPRSATADATDVNGYGVKRLKFSIDGTVVGESPSQACEVGGCNKSQTFSIDMSTYSGGAHAATISAEDLAGNVRSKNWTINVDPEGHISATEAEDTLEALDATSPVNTVGSASLEDAYEGTSDGLAMKTEGGVIVATGSATPTSLTSIPGEVELEVASPDTYVNCPDRAAESQNLTFTGPEEEALATTVSCPEPLPVDATPDLTPVVLEPVATPTGSTQALTSTSSAAVTPNISANVDLVTRPLFDGAMTFAAIRDKAGSETFSWRVNLEPDQKLVAVDAKTVHVKYSDGPTAFSILAAPAHDAVGTSVPTELLLSGDIVTLKVLHRGGSFVYPVVGGAGWEGGFQTFQIVMPSTGEEPGELEGSAITQDYSLLEVGYGPPEDGSGSGVPLIAQQSGKPTRKRRYKFNDCRFNVNGPDSPPKPPGVKRLKEELAQECHGSYNNEYYTLDWAIAVHGTYFYTPHQYTWIKEPPTCRKWGPEPPAKLRCAPESTDATYGKKMSVHGKYRFGPGKFGTAGAPLGQATCYEMEGVLPAHYWQESPDEDVLQNNFHVRTEEADPGEACDWNDLKKLPGTP